MNGLNALKKAFEILHDEPALTRKNSKKFEGKLVKVWYVNGDNLKNENEYSVDPESYYPGHVSVFPKSIIINYKDGTTEKRYFKDNWPEWSIKIH